MFAHADEYRVETLIPEMDAAGVQRAVLALPAYEGDRNDVCLAAAARHPDRFAVMGRLAVADPKSRGLVAGWRDQPGMLGMRLSFARGAAGRYLSDGTADWLWPEAEMAGLPLMIFAPGQLDQVEDIARRHPGLRLVIDHLGLKPGQCDAEIDPILDQSAGMAELPNVAVKATCLPSHVSDPFPFPFLHERIRRMVETYSPRRVFWGSDLTRLTTTYGEALWLFTEELTFLSPDDLDWIMDRGVREWIGWSVEPSVATDASGEPISKPA